MALYSQEFKVQSVEKALSRRTDQTLNNVAYYYDHEHPFL
jgi:hypothetical protein